MRHLLTECSRRSFCCYRCVAVIAVAVVSSYCDSTTRRLESWCLILLGSDSDCRQQRLLKTYSAAEQRASSTECYRLQDLHFQQRHADYGMAARMKLVDLPSYAAKSNTSLRAVKSTVSHFSHFRQAVSHQ